MKLQLKDFADVLVFAFFIGATFDAFSISPFGGIASVVGFSIIAPLTVLISFFIFKGFDVKNMFFIVCMSAFLFLMATMFGFWQWIELRNLGTDMSGLLFPLSFIPSIIVGLIFGFIMFRKIKGLS